ncbi:MAG: FkbM family methyltransferase [Alphaproteobacteria bacterium]|nr:FkbM family methyltransferase [Alphaproteobacteria bacterium]
MSTSDANNLLNNPLFKKTPVYEALKNQPLGFIDVGARDGIESLVNPVQKATSVLAFEPDKESYEELKKADHSIWANYNVTPYGLADKKGSAPLYLLRAATNHSLLQPNQRFIQRYNMEKFELVGQTSIPTITLDEIIFSSGLCSPCQGEFIKLDTQGSEYEILMGSKQTLKENTVGVLAEVWFCHTYENQKLFSDIELYLRDFGFVFYGFTTLHQRSRKSLDKKQARGRERLLYADALFIKDPIENGLDFVNNKREICIAFLIAFLLGYYDFAIEIGMKYWNLSTEEQENLFALINHYAFVDPSQTRHNLSNLMEKINNDQEKANILMGKYCDSHRTWCDYDEFSGSF